LLQILEDGRLTDSKGKTVNFKNTIIIMTSNIGAHMLKKQKTLGFSIDSDKAETEYEKMKENIMEELKRSFRPEFLNRIDDTIVFHSLVENDLIDIVNLMLESIKERVEQQEIHLEFDEDSKKTLIKEGTDLAYGARPLRRVITKKVEDKLAEELLKGTIKKGDKIKVTSDEGNLVFSPVPVQ
jgi:ATP-dependent Clp protease ATP-binding subunit ClpC